MFTNDSAHDGDSMSDDADREARELDHAESIAGDDRYDIMPAVRAALAGAVRIARAKDARIAELEAERDAAITRSARAHQVLEEVEQENDTLEAETATLRTQLAKATEALENADAIHDGAMSLAASAEQARENGLRASLAAAEARGMAYRAALEEVECDTVEESPLTRASDGRKVCIVCETIDPHAYDCPFAILTADPALVLTAVRELMGCVERVERNLRREDMAWLADRLAEALAAEGLRLLVGPKE